MDEQPHYSLQELYRGTNPKLYITKLNSVWDYCEFYICSYSSQTNKKYSKLIHALEQLQILFSYKWKIYNI